MPSSTSSFTPTAQFISTIKRFIPKEWKQGVKFDEQPICVVDSMTGSWFTSLMDSAIRGNLSIAFRMFTLIKHQNLSSDGYFDCFLDSIASLLFCCTTNKSLPQGSQLHAQIISLGLGKNLVLVPKLVTFYLKLDLLVDARVVTEDSKVFHALPWNLVISSYVRKGLFWDAICVYKTMLNEGVRPDNFTYPAVLKACGEELDLGFGKEVHRLIRTGSLEWSLFVHNALVSMYCKFGELGFARQLFDIMPARDSVSWNTMISGYASQGMWEEAFQLFEIMRDKGAVVNIITWNTIAGGCLRTGNFHGALNLLQLMRGSFHHLDHVAIVIGLGACAHNRLIKIGREIHGYAIRIFLDMCDNIRNALITMYSRCEDLGHACIIFKGTEEKTIVTWNSMISALARVEQSKEASFIFREMLHSGIRPNHVTIASMLPLCARVANLQHGKEFHCYIMKHEEFDAYLLLWNALVDMYARSGRILEAKSVFDLMEKRDEVTYTSMIAGYGMKGEGRIALQLFDMMLRLQIKPDHVTMVAVLTACSHSGLVMQGQMLFERMLDTCSICPHLEHYACTVDLFGRAGLLNKAKQIITGMPYRATPAMWATLIGACRIHGNTDIGEWAAGKLLEMKPEHSGYYVLIANMYAAAGRWSKLAEVRTSMRDLGVRKAHGCAWVDAGNEVSPFLVGDSSNPHAFEIYSLMDGMSELMKDAGHDGNEEVGSSEEDYVELNAVGNICCMFFIISMASYFSLRYSHIVAADSNLMILVSIAGETAETIHALAFAFLLVFSFWFFI